ncbi:MAG: hypothetical protein P9L99_15470 [Candidatus Lernaella stagnicola]|nr:hypothetical protein [Candidatus Lernaella stagnicola]
MRIFIYTDLMHELQKLSKVEENHALGQAGSTPLYVMMNMTRPSNDVFDLGLDDDAQDFINAQELEELFSDEDGELIEELENHPDLFRAIPFELEDGSEALAYDFVRRSLYTMHRIQDESDWDLAMRTYDPTWVIGPSIPQTIRKQPASLIRPLRRRRR